MLMPEYPANYGWFRAVLDQRVVEVCGDKEVEFRRTVQTAFPDSGPLLSGAQVLDRLETLSDGWKAWSPRLESGEVHSSIK